MANDQLRISEDDVQRSRFGWLFIVAAVLFAGYGCYRMLHPTATMIPLVIVFLSAIVIGVIGIKSVLR